MAKPVGAAMTSAVLDRPKTSTSPSCIPKRVSVPQTEAPSLACADIEHDLPLPSRKPGGSEFAVEGLFALVRVWRERQRVRRRLADMSERELQDVGICQSDIACEIAKPVWRALTVSNAAR
jgi:uncharacterized protein YjiS (DUF1127 family)